MTIKHLAILFVVSAASVLLDRRYQRDHCESYSVWTPDRVVHAGTRQTCPHTHDLSIQSSMDGYTVICQCRR